MKVNDEGKLTWCSQEYSPYRNWCAGQPTVTEDKQCVAFNFNEDGDTGCLSVENCEDELFSVCQPKRCDAKNEILQMVNVIMKAQRSITAKCTSCRNRL